MAHPADILADALAEVLEQSGREIVEEVQTLISIPVESIDGRLIRSVRGENPRAETFALLESIEHLVKREGDDVSLLVSTDREYAPRLQHELDRPIFTGIGEEWMPVIVGRLADNLTRRNS